MEPNYALFYLAVNRAKINDYIVKIQYFRATSIHFSLLQCTKIVDGHGQGRPPGLFNTLKAYKKCWGEIFLQFRGRNVRICSKFLTCSSLATQASMVVGRHQLAAGSCA